MAAVPISRNPPRPMHRPMDAAVIKRVLHCISFLTIMSTQPPSSCRPGLHPFIPNLTLMETYPLNHGVMTESGVDTGTVSRQMIRDRAAAIALINGEAGRIAKRGPGI